MATFDEFYKSLDPDSGIRGKQFEKFVKWFLKTDPEWQSQVEEVWLWDEYPESWGPDCGIDLVFKHKNGKTWAVQSKCYSPEHDISKSEIDSFLSESSDARIDGRLLIASTDGIGRNALTIPITKIIASAENPTFLTIDLDSSVMYCHLGRRGMS